MEEEERDKRDVGAFERSYAIPILLLVFGVIARARRRAYEFPPCFTGTSNFYYGCPLSSMLFLFLLVYG